MTKKCFVEITHQNPKKNKIHPLPLLLANGGGDYRGRNEEYVGNWVGDVVYSDDTVPDGF